MLHLLWLIGIGIIWFMVSNGIGAIFDTLEDWSRG